MDWLPPGDETSFMQGGIPAITVGVVPSKDIELIQSYLQAIREKKLSMSLPSTTETIHNGPRDSIEVIQETALQTAYRWVSQLVSQFSSTANNYSQ